MTLTPSVSGPLERYYKDIYLSRLGGWCNGAKPGGYSGAMIGFKAGSLCPYRRHKPGGERAG